MKVRLAIIFKDREKDQYQWQISIPREEFGAVGCGRRVEVSVSGSNILLKFSEQGRVFNVPPQGHFATCGIVSSVLPKLGEPICKCSWWLEAKQVSTNPVSFALPVPDTTGYVKHESQSVVNGGTSGGPREDTRTAMDLLNEHLVANPAFKAYVRQNGTIGVRVMIEEDL